MSTKPPMTVQTKTQHSPDSQNQNPVGFGWLDEELSSWLKKKQAASKNVVLIIAGATCKVYEKDDATGSIHSADPENKAKTAFKALAKKKLLLTVDIQQPEIDGVVSIDTSWTPKEISADDVETLLGRRNKILGRISGRGDPISPSTANKVWADAGGCCMFKGCAQDLSVIPLYNKSARIAYLAHIIASDPLGPRGTYADSHCLADAAENIMLMCDAHHRLIDVFASETYKAPLLQEMRREHTDKVRMYREALKFTQAQVMTIFGGIGQIATNFSESVFMETLLTEQLSMRPGVKRHLEYAKRDARTADDFWGQYIDDMRLQITAMVLDLAQPKADDVLAVFPLHHTPTLVLAGRITGEARPVQVFQKSRARDSWKWNQEASAHPPGTFKVIGDTNGIAAEVLLTVELTAQVDATALPSDISSKASDGSMRWIRLTLDSPNGECLQRKEDLEQVVDVARATINSIQDKIRAKRVHLIILSPASAVFRIGQIMQPGHHSDFIIYDRSDRAKPFREAFTITGHSVNPPSGTTYQPISIR